MTAIRDWFRRPATRVGQTVHQRGSTLVCALFGALTITACADAVAPPRADSPRHSPGMVRLNAGPWPDLCYEEWSYYPSERAWYREGVGEWWYTDPFEQCPGYYDRGWGDEFNDGKDFVGWSEVAQFQADHHDVISESLETCPHCRITQIVERVATNPTMREFADEVAEAVRGMGHRIVYEWNRVGPYLYDRVGQWHHVATNKNSISGLTGGPWTPRFQDLFSRAGASLTDPRNKVYVIGHVGPHKSDYHSRVYNRLRDALDRAGPQAFWDELAAIAHECATPGTVLHALCTNR